MKVVSGTRTSSPGPISSARRPRTRASDPVGFDAAGYGIDLFLTQPRTDLRDPIWHVNFKSVLDVIQSRSVGLFVGTFAV